MYNQSNYSNYGYTKIDKNLSSYEIFNIGVQSLIEHKISYALEVFEELTKEYPFSKTAKHSLIMEIFLN